MKKNEVLRFFGFLGNVGEKQEIRVFGWPAVVSRWWGEWMLEVGWAYLDFREERGREGGVGVYGSWERNGRNEKL
jgi:hypothetical protein